MPQYRQGNLFAGQGVHDFAIGDSIFDPIGRSVRPPGAASTAEISAVTLMGPNRPGRTPFGIPYTKPGINGQQSFNFAGSTRKASLGSRFAKGAMQGLGRGLSKGAVLAEIAFGTAIIAAGAIEGSAQWGAPTGLEEDYVGGAVYGATKGVGTAVGGAVGGLGGFALGAGIGSIIPGAGTVVGGIIGGAIGLASSLAGYIGGEYVGGNLAQGPARKLGLGARAIVKTARAVDRVQFGGNFVDSRAAHTMRQRAVADMSGSMLNARQFLGNEAIFLHER